MTRWSVVLLLSLLVPSLDAVHVVRHARLERQQQQVLAASADLVDASAVVDTVAGAGVGTEAFRLAFCAVWGGIGSRGAGYFAFSAANANNLNAQPQVFWVPTAVAACPNALQVAVTGCGTTCVGIRTDFDQILNKPHIHFANYAAATNSAQLRLSLKNRCNNGGDFHHPAGDTRYTTATATGLTTTYGGIGCTQNPQHAHATAAITAWNTLFA